MKIRGLAVVLVALLTLTGCAAARYQAGCADLACELAARRPVDLVLAGFPPWHQATVDRAPAGRTEPAIRQDLDRCYVEYLRNGRPYLVLIEDERTRSETFWAGLAAMGVGSGLMIGGIVGGSNTAFAVGAGVAGVGGVVSIGHQLAAKGRMVDCLRTAGYAVR